MLTIYEKGHYKIYCLQRLRNIGINFKILALYYQSCVETLVTSCLICWYGSVNLHSKKLLNNIVKVCSNTVEQKSLYNIFNHRVEKRQKGLCPIEIMYYQCIYVSCTINVSINYCHPVVALGV